MSILKALVDHYEDLLSAGKVGRFGWSDTKISYALYLSEDGELLDMICLLEEIPRGKKIAKIPCLMTLPTPVKRGTNILPNFMWDNSTYLFGIDKDLPDRALDCFKASKNFHKRLLSGLNSPAAKAVLAFFQKWDPERAAEHPALKDIYSEVIASGNFCFIVNDEFAHDDPAIRNAWKEYYENDSGEECMVCLDTGEKSAVARLHPLIKGVPGGQPTGTSLISFNAESFCSFGREQGYVAPVSRYTAFAYAVALNHLIADFDHVCRIGETLILSWATGGEAQYQDAFSASVFGNEEDGEKLNMVLRDLLAGKRVEYEDAVLDPEKTFYVLGISANGARLVVRFFFKNSFGTMLKSVEEHHRRMEIVAPSFDPRTSIPLWQIMRETVRSADDDPLPNLSNQMAHAIITDTRYPASILSGITMRIRADKDINRTRAAMIKAYYLKNTNKDVPKEVLTVSLNPDATSIPYNLGRLFSVLEFVQRRALGQKINSPIKDRYFNAASATPGRVFPLIVNLAQAHLNKIKYKPTRIFYAKLINEIMDKLGETYPIHLTLPEQGAFQLGYYHQTQELYTSRSEKDEVEAAAEEE